MSPKQGQIVGSVVYSDGDGPEQTIPVGPCEIAATSQDATISWDDEGRPSVAAIPILQYTTYLTEGAITVER